MSNRWTATSVRSVMEGFEENKLLGHVLEWHPTFDGVREREMLDALAGKPGATHITNHAPQGLPVSPKGIWGLATTALNPAYPVPLWDDASSIILFFSLKREGHICPILVSGSDAFSVFPTMEYMQISNHAVEALPTIKTIQELPCTGGYNIPLTRFKEDREGFQERGISALGEMWKKIGEMGWDQYCDHSRTCNDWVHPGMNEVNVEVSIGALVAVGVYKNTCSGPVGPASRDITADIAYAKNLAQDIAHDHPNIFRHPLHVFVYDPHAQQKLYEAPQPEKRMER